MEPGFKLISALCDHTLLENSEVLATALVLWFDYHERSMDLVVFALSRELRLTRAFVLRVPLLVHRLTGAVAADARQLFREDRISFRILSNFMRFVANDWLVQLLRPIIREACSSATESYEATSEAAAAAAAAAAGTGAFVDLCAAASDASWQRIVELAVAGLHQMHLDVACRP